MTFTTGETIVYPHHGAVVIEETATRVIGGVERECLKLRVAQADLTIQIPSKNMEMVGVHDIMDKEDLKHVFKVLRTTRTEEPSSQSRRCKANVEKVATGDIMKVAEVVHDSSRRDSKKGLSVGEKRMLGKARQILVPELALAEKTNEEDTSNHLDGVLAS